MGGSSVFWDIAGRFSGVGDPMNLRLSMLRFWLDGHNKMLNQES